MTTLLEDLQYRGIVYQMTDEEKLVKCLKMRKFRCTGRSNCGQPHIDT